MKNINKLNLNNTIKSMAKSSIKNKKLLVDQ